MKMEKISDNCEYCNKNIYQCYLEKIEYYLDEYVGQDLIEFSENKICKYCNLIKNKSRFRHNRLKCKDCERDEPLDKLKRLIRSRIISALKNKQKHTIEYLGCNIPSYLKWLLNNNKSPMTKEILDKKNKYVVKNLKN